MAIYTVWNQLSGMVFTNVFYITDFFFFFPDNWLMVHIRLYCWKSAKLLLFFTTSCWNIELKYSWYFELCYFLLLIGYVITSPKNSKIHFFHGWLFHMCDFCLNWLHESVVILPKISKSRMFFMTGHRKMHFYSAGFCNCTIFCNWFR